MACINSAVKYPIVILTALSIAELVLLWPVIAPTPHVLHCMRMAPALGALVPALPAPLKFHLHKPGVVAVCAGVAVAADHVMASTFRRT